MAEYVAFGALLGAAVLVLFLLRGRFRGAGARRGATPPRAAARGASPVTCPLCRSALLPGEDLVSRVYRPMDVPDQLCTINGCPHCYPVVQAGLRRECPVCHKQVPLAGGHLTARLFNRPGGKKHVVVTGCTECHKHP